jgi:large subunit ribosomal protein L17
MVYSLVENGRIKTTVRRAKEVRRHVEKAITLGRQDTLNSRRILMSRFPNENVVNLLSTDLKKRFMKRDGGYTRIVRIGARPGDQADIAFLEFVDYVPAPASTAETVKGDVEAAARGKARAAARQRLRKNVRRIRSESRRDARA